MDGVIVPTGTFLRESLDGTELIMRMHKLSKEMIEMIKELKSFSKFSVWIFAKKSSDFVVQREPKKMLPLPHPPNARASLRNSLNILQIWYIPFWHITLWNISYKY
ncbi:MAG: hypothetical protein ABIJ80_00310 [Patescibacteria group bacterium]